MHALDWKPQDTDFVTEKRVFGAITYVRKWLDVNLFNKLGPTRSATVHARDNYVLVVYGGPYIGCTCVLYEVSSFTKDISQVHIAEIANVVFKHVIDIELIYISDGPLAGGILISSGEQYYVIDVKGIKPVNDNPFNPTGYYSATDALYTNVASLSPRYFSKRCTGPGIDGDPRAKYEECSGQLKGRGHLFYFDLGIPFYNAGPYHYLPRSIAASGLTGDNNRGVNHWLGVPTVRTTPIEHKWIIDYRYNIFIYRGNTYTVASRSGCIYLLRLRLMQHSKLSYGTFAEGHEYNHNFESVDPIFIAKISDSIPRYNKYIYSVPICDYHPRRHSPTERNDVYIARRSGIFIHEGIYIEWILDHSDYHRPAYGRGNVKFIVSYSVSTCNEHSVRMCASGHVYRIGEKIKSRYHENYDDKFNRDFHVDYCRVETLNIEGKSRTHLTDVDIKGNFSP